MKPSGLSGLGGFFARPESYPQIRVSGLTSSTCGRMMPNKKHRPGLIGGHGKANWEPTMDHDGTVIRFAVCSEFDSHDSEPRIVSIHRNRKDAEARIVRRQLAIKAGHGEFARCDWWIEPCGVDDRAGRIAPDRAAIIASFR